MRCIFFTKAYYTLYLLPLSVPTRKVDQSAEYETQRTDLGHRMELPRVPQTRGRTMDRLFVVMKLNEA
jgi:hypothetical protein